MTNISLPKFELKLNEESELNFKLTIEGQSPEGTPSKPEFRFIVSEMKEQTLNENLVVSTNGCKGWLYPVSCDKETDIVSIKIAPQKESGGFQVGKKYHGKLEVIVGNLLMTPAEVILEFVQPLQIEATIISKTAVPSITIKSSIVENKSTAIKEDVDAEDEEKLASSVIAPSKKLQEQTRLKRIEIIKERIRTLVADGSLDDNDLVKYLKQD